MSIRKTRRVDPLKVIAYVRCSTTKQGLSLEAQRKVIAEWAATAGVEVVGWHEDPARSGSTHPKRRQGLQAALKAVEDLRAGVLVVAAEDRLSRDVNHAGWIATELDDIGAVVVDASKPESEWISRMFGRMQAQAYLDSLKKNTIRALALKRSRGEKLGGSVPYGFQVVECGTVRRLEPCPIEQPVLLRILELRRAGLGGRRIASTLEAEGYKPRGAAWNPGNLQTMADRLIARERTA